MSSANTLFRVNYPQFLISARINIFITMPSFHPVEPIMKNEDGFVDFSITN